MRRATLADVPKLVEMGAAMHAESRYSKFRLNLSKGEAFFRHIVTDAQFIVLVDGDPVHAMFIGYVNTFWWGDELESTCGDGLECGSQSRDRVGDKVPSKRGRLQNRWLVGSGNAFRGERRECGRRRDWIHCRPEGQV